MLDSVLTTADFDTAIVLAVAVALVMAVIGGIVKKFLK